MYISNHIFMAKSSVVFPILFLLISANINRQVFACILTPSWTVYVTNKSPSSSMLVHCQSKDDDLGNRTLAFGKGFNWSFCESILSNTLFFCHVWWGSKQASFDAFSSKWGRRYHDCVWELKEDGLYLNDDNKYLTPVYTKKVDWQ